MSVVLRNGVLQGETKSLLARITTARLCLREKLVSSLIFLEMLGTEFDARLEFRTAAAKVLPLHTGVLK